MDIDALHDDSGRDREMEINAPNDPKWPWTLQGQKFQICILLSLYRQPFSGWMPFVQMPQINTNGIEHYEVKVTQCMFHYYKFLVQILKRYFFYSSNSLKKINWKFQNS